MSHYFLLTGSINYPPEQVVVQEVTFQELFKKMRKEYTNVPIKQNTKKTAKQKPDVKRRCKWKTKNRMRLKTQQTALFVDSHSPRTGMKKN